MSSFKCVCGHYNPRIAIGKVKGYLGFWCGNCRQKWTAIETMHNDGQKEIWFRYFECHCGSNTLDRKNTYCSCEADEVR